VFIRKNRFFKVPLSTPEGHELTTAEIEVQVERILQLAGEEKGVPVGTLTSENRDVWTDVSDK
jgi:carnitine O-acetyltransferase